MRSDDSSRRPTSRSEQGSGTPMKKSGLCLLQTKNLKPFVLLPHPHHIARALKVRESAQRGRRHSTKTAAAPDEVSDLATAELAHRLRSFVRKALDSARRMAGQQPAG